ncbi:centrosomal protein of 135 kDa-like [Macrosteles quadrilineatus]|uniref:centrosomal protein of 135 kDa-like n=1 Tax=Macrosteles quadrilineatus TaxID=74068 RepID=UPI0023E2C3B9|nr:centrosomal protein of 135 kDa-like [Macrosteles quadrilineatus]
MGTKKIKEDFPINQFLGKRICIGTDDIIEAANTFNEYYVNVGADLASSVPPVSEPIVRDEDYRTDSTFQLTPISEIDLVKLVNNMKGGSAPGDSWEQVYRVAERGLRAVKQWFDQSRLSVNISKTKYMPVSVRADHDPVGLHLRLHTCGSARLYECVMCECIERGYPARLDHRDSAVTAFFKKSYQPPVGPGAGTMEGSGCEYTEVYTGIIHVPSYKSSETTLLTMTPSEGFFLKVRNKLDDLGYLQPLSFESVMLVDKLLCDLLETKKNLQHYKNVAQQSMEACSELRVGVGPYKEDNTRLIKENNDLRQKLLKARESIEDTRVELGKEIRKLEKERALQDYLCNQHASKISQLQVELAHKSAKLTECKGGRTRMLGPDSQRKKDTSKVDKDQMLDKAQDKINSLTREITKLRSDQQQLDEVIECLKNKVNARDSEIERLNNLLSDG